MIKLIVITANDFMENKQVTIQALKEIKIDNKIIEEYLSFSEKSLSTYLEDQYKQAVIADLSAIEIDARFDNKDLSNCKFVGTVFKGTIKNLTMRDCLLEQIRPTESCTLIKPDLRGTSLAERVFDLSNAENEDYVRGVSSIAETHVLTLDDPILSVGSVKHLRNYQIVGNPDLDPCYKGEEEVTRLKDIHKYSSVLKAGEINNCDFTGLDLRNLDLSGKVFTNCNFADAKLSGVKTSGAVFNNCSFYGTDLSSKFGGWWYKAASLTDATFNNCDFTYADLTGVDATKAIFKGLIAININAAGFRIPFLNNKVNHLKLDKAQAEGADFSGAYMPELSAKGFKAKGTNFANTNCRGVDFSGADLQYTNFYKANLRRAEVYKSNIAKARFERAKAANSRWIETEMDGCSFAGMFEAEEIEAFDNNAGKPIECIEYHQMEIKGAKQRKAKALSRAYDNFMIGIVGVSIVAAIAAPLMLSGTTALATGLVLDKIAFAAIIAFAADKISQKILGEEGRFSKKLVEILHIKPVIEYGYNKSKELEDNKIKHEEAIIKIIKQENQVTGELKDNAQKKTYVERLHEQPISQGKELSA